MPNQHVREVLLRRGRTSEGRSSTLGAIPLASWLGLVVRVAASQPASVWAEQGRPVGSAFGWALSAALVLVVLLCLVFGVFLACSH